MLYFFIVPNFMQHIINFSSLISQRLDCFDSTFSSLLRCQIWSALLKVACYFEQEKKVHNSCTLKNKKSSCICMNFATLLTVRVWRAHEMRKTQKKTWRYKQKTLKLICFSFHIYFIVISLIFSIFTWNVPFFSSGCLWFCIKPWPADFHKT